jgi:hypothetical protein
MSEYPQRFLYERSIVYQGHLIIPFLVGKVETQPIYSYALLAAIGHQSPFHQVRNPADRCARSVEEILTVAQKHLDQHCPPESPSNEHFQQRYTYFNHLILVCECKGKYFYDHYPPDQLHNIAAPRLFQSEAECIQWVKEGLDRSRRPKPAQLSDR